MLRKFKNELLPSLIAIAFGVGILAMVSYIGILPYLPK